MPTMLIDPDKIRAEMESMIAIVTNPAFVAAMNRLRETPVNKRREFGKRTLTSDALAAQGVNIPGNMRLTTRYFEPGKSRYLEIDSDGELHPRAMPKFRGKHTFGGTVQWGLCFCGGTGPFAAGAGGSAL